MELACFKYVTCFLLEAGLIQVQCQWDSHTCHTKKSSITVRSVAVMGSEPNH